jgi:hypothetical protein
MNQPQTMTLHSYVPPITEEELARRNQAAIRLLDSWETEGDEQEQQETMEMLRRALGQERTASDRKLFP